MVTNPPGALVFHRQRRFHVIQAILPEEHLSIDEHGRCAERTPLRCLVGIGDQTLLDLVILDALKQ